MATGLHFLRIFLGIKLVGFINGIILVWSIIWALSHIGAAQVKKYHTVIEAIMRIYLYGLPYTIPSYTDLMAYVLLAKLGIDYDPNNPFCQYTFFVIPSILLIPRMVLFI